MYNQPLYLLLNLIAPLLRCLLEPYMNFFKFENHLKTSYLHPFDANKDRNVH